MYGHLVTVEVGVECRADERMDLNCLAFDEDRLERLNTKTVERRCAVQEHWVLTDHVFKYVPDLRHHRVDHLLGCLDVLCRAALNKLSHDERLEKLKCHQLRQTTLMELQRRSGNDYRTT